MPKWYTIGDLGQYQDKNQWLIKINERPIALFKYKNDFFKCKLSFKHPFLPLDSLPTTTFFFEKQFEKRYFAWQN